MFSKNDLNEEATYELKKLWKWKTNSIKMIYKTSNKKNDKTYDFQLLKTIRSFGREIWNNDLSLDDALEHQIR